MSIPKANLPQAAVTESSETKEAREKELKEAAAATAAKENKDKDTHPQATTPHEKPSLDERLKKRIKAHLQAQKREEASASSNFDANKLIEYPTNRYADFGALGEVITGIREVIERPFKHPEIYQHLGVDVPRGVLLYGPPGCGKTCLAMAVAGELGIPLLRISAPEIVSGMSGESEAKIREIFDAAARVAPALIFIDEIDAITPKRENAQREMERRIVAQLLTSMDDLNHMKKPRNDNNSNNNNSASPMIMVIGATNRPDSLDPALRRAGRFDREIKLGIPGEAGRAAILKTLCARLRTVDDESLWSELARKTPGYVGADLKALTREAAAAAINRIFSTRMPLDDVGVDTDVVIDGSGNATGTETATGIARTSGENVPPFTSAELESLAIEREDFYVALGKVQPSAKREGFAVVPNTTWDDIGALSYVREELRLAVVEPIRHPQLFAAVGITAPAGVLLYGPPGCGKTLLAKAVANESHSNFISVKGPELLNKYVGESERAVRQVFERAAASAPCIIFFDEIDALCPRRAQDASSDSSSSRIVNQLLTEMDGLSGRTGVYLLAATNRPDILDPALTRPGRLDKILYVRLPSPEERAEILKTCGRSTPWSPEVDLDAVARDPRADGFSGADLAALVRESSLAAIRSLIASAAGGGPVSSAASASAPPPVLVRPEHIEFAFTRVRRSVSVQDERVYNSLLNSSANK